MNISRIIVGAIDTNCWLVDRGDGSTIIIDPGADAERIKLAIQEKQLAPKAIILTHGHYDHIGAAPSLMNFFNLPAYISHDDKYMVEDARENLSEFFGIHCEFSAEVLSQKTIYELGFEFSLIDLPGHTMGGIGLISREIFISGDTVFAGGGVGRTDLPGGSDAELARSIRKILELDDKLILCAGHAGRSSLGREKIFWREYADLY